MVISESDDPMNPSRIRNGTKTIKKTSQAFTCALQVRRRAPNVVVPTRSASTTEPPGCCTTCCPIRPGPPREGWLSRFMSWNDSDDQASNDNSADQVAMFVLADIPGLLVNVDDDDNGAGHVILHSDAGTKVSFTVFNVGGTNGSCTVDIEVDGTWIKNWTSSDLAPQQSESTEVRGLGRYAKGWHEFLAYVNPVAGHHDHL